MVERDTLCVPVLWYHHRVDCIAEPGDSMTLRLIIALLLATACCSTAAGQTIEDFESGTPALASYAGQDADPTDWQLTSSGAYDGNSLRLHGNTWKTQAVAATA